MSENNDLKDGQAVRLFKGDYNQKTVYSNEKSGAVGQKILLAFKEMIEC